MKVVIAIDSLKGSLTSMDAGLAVKEGILAAVPDAEVIVRPLADGGEGTVDALIEGYGAEKVCLTVTGPLAHPVSCYYGYLPHTGTAIIEMAAAAGITLIPSFAKDPLHATTYGVGELILDALSKGCRDFIIGVGGSATNDGGLGMLKALGCTFHDIHGNDVGEGGNALAEINSIDTSGMNPNLKHCRFQIACDVSNPLCGKNGATYVYGPQKGADIHMISKLDSAMAHFAQKTTQFLNTDYSQAPGAGAAGGLGYAFLSYLNAQLIPGTELILNAIHLEADLKDADIAVTGEGRLDSQTVMGKAPLGVAKLAKKHHAKVIAFAGTVADDADACNQAGIDAFFPIIRDITTLEEAMKPDNARANLRAAANQVFRLL